MNIYVIRFDNKIPTGHETLKDYAAMHVHVLADTFEQALDACRKRYPDAIIKGIERQNYYAGLPVLSA